MCQLLPRVKLCWRRTDTVTEDLCEGSFSLAGTSLPPGARCSNGWPFLPGQGPTGKIPSARLRPHLPTEPNTIVGGAAFVPPKGKGSPLQASHPSPVGEIIPSHCHKQVNGDFNENTALIKMLSLEPTLCLQDKTNWSQNFSLRIHSSVPFKA